MNVIDLGRVARRGDVVELQVPADPAYLAVVRTATAGLAARLDLTLDEIEDLRIAVDESCALLIGHTVQSAEHLDLQFTLDAETLAVHVHGPARVLPDRRSFAWSVLEALAGEVETGATDGGSWIRVRHIGGRRTS